MKTVLSKIVYQQKASRAELIIRFLYIIPLAIIMWAFGILSLILAIVQWFHILFTKKRHREMDRFIRIYVIQVFRIGSYMWLLTDERPPIIPETETS